MEAAFFYVIVKTSTHGDLATRHPLPLTSSLHQTAWNHLQATLKQQKDLPQSPQAPPFIPKQQQVHIHKRKLPYLTHHPHHLQSKPQSNKKAAISARETPPLQSTHFQDASWELWQEREKKVGATQSIYAPAREKVWSGPAGQNSEWNKPWLKTLHSKSHPALPAETGARVIEIRLRGKPMEGERSRRKEKGEGSRFGADSG